MKQSTRLSSAVFQLTPTRTRCDLIIIANEKKEKIASGLLNPFLAHLKAAQDQVAKGGYSVLLVPEKSSDAAWFTKATLERFVRFVSTPEILERVYTIETEIIQIEEAITFQRSSDAGEIVAEHNGRKPLRVNEGDKYLPIANEEKAIVLYTPEATSPETKGSCSPEENMRDQLLKVLEARKTVLQKEQGMAFARAVAAGFDIDYMEHLISFANCFGATRLLNACSRFVDLWKSKHESGQWLNTEASEALPTQSDFCATTSSGIIINDSLVKNDESNHKLASENNGKSGSGNNPSNNPAPNSQQEFQGQFPRIVFPPWHMHAPAGTHPVFPAYPPPGMPYYQAHTGSSPFFQPPHYPMEHFPSNHGPNSGQERHSLDVSNSYPGPGMREVDGTRSSYDMPSDEEVSYSRKQKKRTGGSNRKLSGKVVIQNLNYVTPIENKSDSETDSDFQPDICRENEYYEGTDAIHQKKDWSSRNGRSHVGNDDEVSIVQKDSDNRHWLAFQDCLLRGSGEGANADGEGMFAMERDVKMKRYKKSASEDPLVLSARDGGEIRGDRMGDMQRINGSVSLKLKGSDNEFMLSSTDKGSWGVNDQTDVQFDESTGRKILFRTAKEDFMIDSIGDKANFRNSFDPLAVNNLESGTKRIEGDLRRMSDETLVVPFRSMSFDQVGGTDRTAIDIDSEIPVKSQKLASQGNMKKGNCEANDLNLMPERETNKRSVRYDIGLQYEMEVRAQASDEKGKKKIADVRGGLSKSDTNRRSKAASDPLHKQRTGGPVRKARPSMTGPLEDARARAERLRSYKADLQKMKKEKEEAEARRLEFLKLERKKRIAARVGSNSVKPSILSPQTKQLPAKLSPTTYRGSKFSDSEVGSSSPLQRSKIRIPVDETHKTSKSSKLSEGIQRAGNRLVRSSSSLSEIKREKNGVTPDSKASISTIRRLSEPKTVNKPPVTTVKARSAETALKRKLFEGAEMNKVSAIIDLDRSKAATLPELKIKTPKSLVKTGENNSEVKNKQKMSGVNHHAIPEKAELSVTTFHTSQQIDADDNPIVEKTVLVLKCEKSSLPTLPSSEGKAQVWSQQPNNGVKGEKSNTTSLPAPLHASISSNDGIDKSSISCRSKQSDHNGMRTVYSEKDPPDSANITVAENPYQAPYASVSSLEDQCTRKTEYGKAQLDSTETSSRAEETVQTLVPDVKTAKTVQPDKVSVKKSPKGFRRLLKFGKKNHTSSVDQSIDSECTSTGAVEQEDIAQKMASASEVDSLKNLISRDETVAAGNAPQKSSRHFSFFSLRGKTSEKRRAR